MAKIKVSWTFGEKGASIIASDGTESITIGPLSKMEDLEKEIEALCKEFHFALEKVKGEWFSREREKRSKQVELQDPQALWAVLKGESKDNMIRLFNAQEESVRKLVAKYVFENVNVFSGPGAVFAELYNQETGLLEP